ncbi:MAG: S41 family peptidase [Chloroflexota bacterium]|nr:S41 family peptidase [Chloroflexota bacterium]
MTIRINRWILSVVALLTLVAFFAGGGVAGYVYGKGQSSPKAVAALPSDSQGGAPSDAELWKPVMETYELINKEFYGRPVEREKLVNAAAEGMMKALKDPYSSYLPPAQHEAVREEMRGEFEGIGVYVDVTKDKKFTIVSPIENSPAEKAGLRSGDVILAVNGEKITGKDQAVVVTKIRGPRGTSVRLTIQRGKQAPFDVNVKRDAIKVPQVTYKLINGDIAYIDANIFGDKTTAELDAALRQARQDKAKGVILDLRNNGGGWVTAAQEMIGRFLPSGVAFYEDPTQGPGGEKPKEVITSREVNAYDLPLVVLVNKGSASASEIVSGALQARGRAKLVGEVTFGKGSEQSVHTLSRGSSAHITIAHWLTPDKRDIHGKGLKPDVVVKGGALDTGAAGPQFERAVKVVRSLIK